MHYFLRSLYASPPTAILFHQTMLLYRVGVGFALFIVHGSDKLFHWRQEVQSIPDPFGLGATFSLGIAVFSDFFCALLVMLGLFTRLATLPILGTTLVGFFFVHLGDSWAEKDAPLTYTIMFLLVLLLGPGKYSVDGWLEKKLSRRLGSAPGGNQE